MKGSEVLMRIKKLKAREYGGKRASTAWIVIHYTGNKKDSAKGNANYFHNNRVSAGAHYFVDANDIYESTPVGYKSWSVGRLYSSKYARFWGECTNANSINIEIADDAGGYKATQGIDNALWLTKKLMKEWGIPASHVIRHKDACGKDCPDFFWDDDAWQAKFKDRLTQDSKKKTKAAPAYWQELGQYKMLTNDRLIRADGKLKSKVVGHIRQKNGVYTITAIKHDGKIVYGKLASGAGWISLKRTFVKKV